MYIYIYVYTYIHTYLIFFFGIYLGYLLTSSLLTRLAVKNRRMKVGEDAKAKRSAELGSGSFRMFQIPR